MSSLKNRITGNLAYLFVGEIFSNVLAFVTTIFLARKLTDEGFGLWAFVQAILAYLIIFVDLGLPTFGTREIAKSPDKADFFVINIFLIRSLLAVIIFTAVALTVFIAGLSHELTLLLVLSALWIFSQALNPEFAFQGLERMGGVAAWRILWRVFYLVPIIIFIKGRTDLWLVAIFYSASGILAVLLLAPFLKMSFSQNWWKSVNLKTWLKYIKVSLIMAASVVVIKVYYTFDTFMLGLLDSAKAVGWYQAAYKIIALFVGLAGLVQIAFAPYFSTHEKNDAKLKAGFRYICAIGAFIGGLITVALFVMAGELINMLYGVQYAPSANILMFLSFTVYLIFLHLTYLSSMNYIGLHKEYLKVVIAGAITNIILNAILIPLISTRGAALAAVFANLVILIVSIFIIKKKAMLEFFVIKMMVKSSLVLAAVLYLQNFLTTNFILKTGLACFCYGLFFALLSMSELKYFGLKKN